VTVSWTLGLLARFVHGCGTCTSLGLRLPDLFTRPQSSVGSALQGRFVASGGTAFLSSPWSFPAEDGDDG
jgi:hypothetical protein